LLEALPAVVEATRANGSKRPDAFDAVPRPRLRSRSTLVSPAGAEGIAGGRFNADERLIVTAPGRMLTHGLEQNKNNCS
jgi:hypothetical protein